MTTTTTPVVPLAPLVFDEASHVYTHADGHRPPSVTAILGAVPPWLGRFDRVDPARLDYRRELGRQVHRATQYDDEGALDEASVDAVVEPVLAWRLFRLQTRFTPCAVETMVFHPLYRYAGTVDRIGATPAASVLLDIKTGDGLAAGPQTAAYLSAWIAMHATMGHDVVEHAYERWTVELRPDETYRLHVHRDRRDWRVFLAALELYAYTARLTPRRV